MVFAILERRQLKLAKTIWRIIVEFCLYELHLYMYICMKLYLVSEAIESTYPSVNLYESFPSLQTNETLYCTSFL